MIITVTPNPALDVTYPVPRLTPGSSHRVQTPRRRAGGKGFNVASVLAGLGRRALALGIVGGETGSAFEADLLSRRLDHRLVHIATPTRSSVAITDDQHGATLFNEVGEPVPEQAWQALTSILIEELPGAECVCVCGSFAPGVPRGWTAQIVRACRQAGVPVVLDVAGPQLMDALSAGPDLVKPNVREAVETVGIVDPARSAELLVSYGADAAIVSDGERGLITVTSDGGRWCARPGETVAGNPTGAGDALTAALATALAAGPGVDWPQALRTAVSWSAAAVQAPVAGEVDPADVERFAAGVRVQQCELEKVC